MSVVARRSESVSRGATSVSLGALSLVAAVAAVALLVAACGGSGGGGAGARLRQPNSVAVYSSLPMHGPSATDGNAVASGIELALTQADGRAGRFKVVYGPAQRLDDGSRSGGGWGKARTAANARRAAADPSAVYYIGELNPVASAVSMPILKLAGIPQMSLGSLVPGNTVQAAAELMTLKAHGCTKLAVGYDGAVSGLAARIKAIAPSYGFAVVNLTKLPPDSKADPFPQAVHQAGADCVILAGSASRANNVITLQIHQLVPSVLIMGTAGICTRTWTNPNYGGVQPIDDRFLMCTRPLTVAQYPGGEAFEKAYEQAYGGALPSPYALFGYTAMQLGLQAIASAGRDGDNRAAVRSALFSVDHPSALGTFAIEPDGQTTLSSYGLYGVGHNLDPVYERTLNPAGAP